MGRKFARNSVKYSFPQAVENIVESLCRGVKNRRNLLDYVFFEMIGENLVV